MTTTLDESQPHGAVTDIGGQTRRYKLCGLYYYYAICGLNHCMRTHLMDSNYLLKWTVFRLINTFEPSHFPSLTRYLLIGDMMLTGGGIDNIFLFN